MAEPATPYLLFLGVAMLLLPFEIGVLARRRDLVRARTFLRYRDYVRVWVTGGFILTPAFFVLLGAGLLDLTEPAWPFGYLSLATLGIAIPASVRVLWAMREG